MIDRELLIGHQVLLPSDNKFRAEGRLRPSGTRIEVKYAESLGGDPARHRPRYDEVADAMGAFMPEARDRLRKPPLEQFWRDHLLAGSLLLDDASGFDVGAFAVVYPEGNTVVGKAVDEYRACLRDTSTFVTWTLERVLDAADEAGAAAWASEVRERYSGWGAQP
ncbi:MAG TPA: hypothetical protein PLI95_18155 [Polyangiaceae bacterium]|nr:hypothetical protein [Polyangiaceae bacterium]